MARAFDRSRSHSPVNIISIDIGTTTIAGHHFDSSGISLYHTSRKVELLYPQPGGVELDPDVLWEQFVDVITEVMEASNLQAEDVTALGISTMRGTFITWDRKTGKPYHNFISWQDMRAGHCVESWNKSLTLKSLNVGSKFLHMISRQKKYLAGSVISFSTQHTSIRLHWLFKTHPDLAKKADLGNLAFGTIDSWLIWKLTKGQLHVTDYSNASGTGMFDPFIMEWSSIMTSLLSVPLSIFPKVVDTSGLICESHKAIFGAPIPVRALVADQQAAVFGQCCFDAGDVNCTMGTGSFIDINTGPYPHASVAGLYPIVGWKIGGETVYLAEGNAAGCGTAMEWAHSMGFYDDVSQTSDMAFSVETSGGVYFVPAFNGLQAPINDNKACVSLMGIKSTTNKAHIMRAILESIAFRFTQLYETVVEETHIPLMSSVKVDGGISNNDFVLELMSSLTCQTIDRPSQTDMSTLGAAFLAGLSAGVWKSRDELKAIRCSQALFQPKASIRDKFLKNFDEWKEALHRSMNWYKWD
nr:putative glycerol kinase 5 [Pocillopora verrucosa]